MQNPFPPWVGLSEKSEYLPSWLDNARSAFAVAGVELPKERVLAAAHAALNKLRPDDALQAFRVADVSPPQDELARCGIRCFDGGLLDEAVCVFTHLDEKSRLRDCANAFLNQGEILKANFLFHCLGATLPSEKVRELGDAWFEQGNVPRAMAAYAEINASDRLEKCAREYLARGWFFSAQAIFDRLKIAKPVDEILVAAQHCLEQGRVIEAIDGFSLAGVAPPLEPLLAHTDFLISEFGKGRAYDEVRRFDRVLTIALGAMRVTDGGTRKANDFVLRLAAECVEKGVQELVHNLLSFLDDDLADNSFDKSRLAACGYECLRQGFIFEAETFFKATGTEVPSAKFQEAGERFLEQGKYRDAHDAYQVAGVPMPTAGLLAWGKVALRDGHLMEARIILERCGAEMTREELLAGADESMRRGQFVLATDVMENAVGPDAARVWATQWGNEWLDQGMDVLAHKCFAFAGITPSEDATLREKFLACGQRHLETFEREGDRLVQAEYMD